MFVIQGCKTRGLDKLSVPSNCSDWISQCLHYQNAYIYSRSTGRSFQEPHKSAISIELSLRLVLWIWKQLLVTTDWIGTIRCI